MDWFDSIKTLLFPQISRRAAMAMARQIVSKDTTRIAMVCHRRQPKNVNAYLTHKEPCWWIITQWNDGHDSLSLRSSRLILIGKLTGRVYYDGSAKDEG